MLFKTKKTKEIESLKREMGNVKDILNSLGRQVDSIKNDIYVEPAGCPMTSGITPRGWMINTNSVIYRLNKIDKTLDSIINNQKTEKAR